MPRKKSNPADRLKPVLYFEPPVKKQKFNVEIALPAAELLKQYPAFIKDSSGASPTVDEVVEKCILKLLGGDKAFKEYLDKDSRNPESGQSGNK